MRKLSPFKAISHALRSVMNYRAVALRIGLLWAPVMLVAGLADIYAGPPDPMAEPSSSAASIQLLTGIVALVAVSSMAVSWHRFILRDELGPSLRLDGNVLRYAGNTVLIMLAIALPILAMLVGVIAVPAAGVIVGAPLLVVFGALATRLSIKLPAVALGNKDFSFRDAWAASAGNFLACAGVFLINAGILIAILLVLTLLAGLFAQFSETFSLAFQLVAAVALQMFLAIFNASIFTSLYGFFVERRDF